MTKRVKLSEVAELITKGTTPTTLGFDFQDSGINFLKIECFDDYGSFISDKVAHISDECNEKLKRSQLKKGDVLFSIAGAIGRVAIVTEDMLPANTNQALAIIRINREDVYLPYIKLILTSPIIREQFERKKQGVAQLNLSLKDIGDLEIPLSSYEKQIEYAETFDRVKNIIAFRKQELKELDNLIESRFVEMFGDPAINEKNWIIIDLESVTTIVTYGLTVRPEYIDDGIELVSARELHKGYVAYGEAPKISLGDFKKLSEKGKPQKNDILFSKTGSIGHCALVEDEKSFAITQNAARIGLDIEKVNPVWLLYYLRMDYIQNWCKNHAKGNAVKDFQLQDMKVIPLFDCSLELQNKFADFVNQVDKSKFVVQKALDEAQTLFDSLMQEYFS